MNNRKKPSIKNRGYYKKRRPDRSDPRKFKDSVLVKPETAAKYRKRPETSEITAETSYSGTRFDKFGLSSGIMKALDKKGYAFSSSVQSEVIPPMMEYRDVIAKAPTGTGKTFAFGIPIIEQLDQKAHHIQALIMAPTRELVLQIKSELSEISAYLPHVKVEAVYGGKPIEGQIKALAKKPQIIVATPGRLKDHMERRTIDITNVRTAVLDEADRMLDMGFIDDVSTILNMLKNRKNLALLSATMSIGVMNISWLYQKDPVEITVAEDKENKPDITQYSIMLHNLSAKMKAVSDIMDNNELYKVLVFCNTINMVRRLTDDLVQKGYSASCIYGGKSQSGREKAIRDFRSERLNMLIATDVAARGLDITDVDAVINFDLPDDKEQYIHRIGRTGRALKNGIAVSLVTPFDIAKYDEILSYCKYSKSDIVNIENVKKPVLSIKEDADNDN